MAKKKKTAQKNKVVQIQKKVQKKSAVVRSDANIEGTEEAKKLLAEVPNPFKANFLYCICGIVAGALVALIPLFMPELQDVYIMGWLGLGTAATSLIYLFVFRKRSNRFKSYMAQEHHRIVWKYPDSVYELYVKDMDKLVTRPTTLQAVLVLGSIVVIAGLMAFASPEGSRWLIIPIALILLMISCVFMFISPKYFLANAHKKPFVSVVDVHQALILGRYHNWKKASAAIRKFPADFQIQGLALSIDYEVMSLGGKMNYEWSALLPDQSQETIEEVQRVVRAINNYSKEREAWLKRNGDWMTRMFKRMAGNEVEPFRPEGKTAEEDQQS